MYQPKGKEQVFPITPLLVTYPCEYCNEGEMKVVVEPVSVWPPPSPNLHKHYCTKCGGELLLPKSYPYIEWNPGREYDEFYKKTNSD